MSKEKQKKMVEVPLSAVEREMVEASLRTLPASLRNLKVAKLLATTLRDRQLARKLQADPRRYFAECGLKIPRDVTLEVHRYTQDTYHLVLPCAELRPYRTKKKGKVNITDADLMSGTAYAKWKDLIWNKDKTDGKDPKQVGDSDDKAGGSWAGDDSKGDHVDPKPKADKAD